MKEIQSAKGTQLTNRLMESALMSLMVATHRKLMSNYKQNVEEIIKKQNDNINKNLEFS